MKKILITFMVLWLVSLLSVNASLVMNDIVPAFQDDTEKYKIENKVIEGAAHFLKSKSFADIILYEYEKSTNQTLNYTALLENTENAISELESSKLKYIEALEIGRKTGYDETKTDWFKNFDYDTFINANHLNKDIAFIVKDYLARGDITGLYQKNISNIEEILITLNSIKEYAGVNSSPPVATFWKLLRQYSETALFGNYSTIIAGSILKID